MSEVGLAYDEVGHGPAVVLLHAFPLDRRMWQETASTLSSQFRVITVDFRGFGESMLGSPPSIADHAEDVARLLDARGIITATFVGCSMGGYVALALAAHHPARVAGLVLVDTRASADSPPAQKGRNDAIAQVTRDGVAAFTDPLISRLLAPSPPAELLAELRAQAAEQTPAGIVSALTALRDRPDRSGELHTIVAPTLVMRGALDAVISAEEAAQLTAAIPGAEQAEIAGAGHLPNLEAPAIFCERLRSFLETV